MTKTLKTVIIVIGSNSGAFGERATGVKATIGSDQVQVEIKLLKITKRVNSDGGGTWDGLIERDCLL